MRGLLNINTLNMQKQKKTYILDKKCLIHKAEVKVEVKILIIEFGIRKSVSFDMKRPDII